MKKSTKKSSKKTPLPEDEHKLSKNEWEILEILWTNGPAIGSRIQSLFNKNRKGRRQGIMSVGAVRSYLDRMVKKGFVRAYKEDGGVSHFEAIHDRETLLRREINDLSNKCFGGDPYEMIAAILQNHRPASGDINRLKKTLADLGKGR